jgi:hypothetical protein
MRPDAAIVTGGRPSQRPSPAVAAPSASASSGIVTTAELCAAPVLNEARSSTPRRTLGSGSLGPSDGITETSASAQVTAAMAPTFHSRGWWLSAARATNTPATAPSVAERPITSTGSVERTMAKRAGCMHSGTSTAAPMPAKSEYAMRDPMPPS